MSTAAILSAAGVVAIKMADAALDKAADKLGIYLADKTSEARDKLIVDFRLGFQTFLQSSYERCRTYKTLLNPYIPLPVLDKYIHVDVEIGEKRFTDDTLIEGIRPNTRVIVTGLAGGGKSMLMKYLALRVSEEKSGLLPLFIELRRFNSQPEKTLEGLVLESMRIDSLQISEEQLFLDCRRVRLYSFSTALMS